MRIEGLWRVIPRSATTPFVGQALKVLGIDKDRMVHFLAESDNRERKLRLDRWLNRYEPITA